MQYAIVILDGASGGPVPEFEGLTSLEVSKTPFLDRLAQAGRVGLVQNVPSHLESSSDVACLSIVGYDPSRYPIGRGAIEGAALGIDLEPGQVALRLNLCSLEEGVMRSYSTDNLATEESHALARELKAALDDDTFTLHLGVSFRHILVVNGHPEIMDLIFETPHDNADQNIVQAYIPKVAGEAIQETSDLLVGYMKRANEILDKSKTNERRVAAGEMPANFAWVFWPGMKPDSMESFEATYHKKAALNSAVDLLDGIALLTGIKTYQFEGVTDDITNNFASQGRGAITMLEKGNDVVIVHVEAPDTAGHDGRPDEKQKSIEKSDSEIIAPLVEYAQQHPLRIVAMPDHPTPLATRKHSHEPVPFVVAGPGIRHNGRVRLTEKEACASGDLVDPGYKFLHDVLFKEVDGGSPL